MGPGQKPSVRGASNKAWERPGIKWRLWAPSTDWWWGRDFRAPGKARELEMLGKGESWKRTAAENAREKTSPQIRDKNGCWLKPVIGIPCSKNCVKRLDHIVVAQWWTRQSQTPQHSFCSSEGSLPHLFYFLSGWGRWGNRTVPWEVRVWETGLVQLPQVTRTILWGGSHYSIHCRINLFTPEESYLSLFKSFVEISPVGSVFDIWKWAAHKVNLEGVDVL